MLFLTVDDSSCLVAVLSRALEDGLVKEYDTVAIDHRYVLERATATEEL